jgi:hypothetical protein
MTLADENVPDPEMRSDAILREVADDVLAGVFVTDTGMRHIHHPLVVSQLADAVGK